MAVTKKSQDKVTGPSAMIFVRDELRRDAQALMKDLHTALDELGTFSRRHAEHLSVRSLDMALKKLNRVATKATVSHPRLFKRE